VSCFIAKGHQGIEKHYVRNKNLTLSTLLRKSMLEKLRGCIHGEIVAATIAPTGCGDDRGDDPPVYTLRDDLFSVMQF